MNHSECHLLCAFPGAGRWRYRAHLQFGRFGVLLNNADYALVGVIEEADLET